MKFIIKTYNKLANLLSKLPLAVLDVFLRGSIFIIFWKSVQTKFSGLSFFGQDFAFWNINSSTFFLFELEYDLPILPYELAAYLGTFAEFFLSILIFLGLFTRLAAIGLLTITLTIQIFVYPDAWPLHLSWAAILLTIIKYGSNVFSFDYWLRK
ncbi:MAG: DoxX family protein [Saccharospirillaceae bacterium]|nr:DoxX family protein [Pseudomonadales bacterium]NRB77971.1 DoxX family protein [Saccharospirillaceae bacterium]